MEFSEALTPWRSIPDWASCLMEFGYDWQDGVGDSRRIAVISMPADSAAAGLVALGVIRRYLEMDQANDTSSHYERLLAMARRHTSDVTLRHTSLKGVFVVDKIDQDGVLWVRKLNDDHNMRVTVKRFSSLEWRIHGEAPVVLLNGQEVPKKQLYDHLIKRGDAIKPSNLSESHSEVCLAGRVTGETATRAIMKNIRFRNEGQEEDLSQLLTVQSWKPGTISRLLFYNSRTGQFDRETGKPQVVITDGDRSLLKVIDDADFKDCDVIGIFHRTIERDRLEAIGSKLENLRQWYDQAAVSRASELPIGVGIFMLKRRQICQ